MAEEARNVETAPAGDTSSGCDGAKGRRQFLTAGFGAIAAGAATAAALSAPRPKTSKSKILARIEEELDKEYLNDPLTYTTTGFDQYVKGS